MSASDIALAAKLCWKLWHDGYSIEKFMKKFYGLGTNNKMALWHHIKWAMYQQELQGYKARLNAHSFWLNLAATSVHHSSVKNMMEEFESRFLQSLEQHLTQLVRVEQKHSQQLILDFDSQPSTPHTSFRSSDAYSEITTLTIPDREPLLDDELENVNKAVKEVVADAAKKERNLQKTLGSDDANVPQKDYAPINPPALGCVVSLADTQRFETVASIRPKSGRITVDDYLRTNFWWLIKVSSMHRSIPIIDLFILC
ncbi:hypothetical protein K440DRAFT_644288 [Wilcoxina mikolae CBS 423.85]|nr:hypothetical protein K440DRAFT_644288 [Wilcoxina mikolae CBS 423.85]